MAEEGLEASRNIRDSGFSNLTNGTNGLAISANQWTFSGTSDTTDIFTRRITISDLGTNRKQVVSTVNWTQNLQRAGSAVLTTELSNWTWQIGNWANPSQEATIDLAGIQNGNKIQVQGNYAYIVRNGGVPEFVIVDVTNPGSPSVIGSLTLSGAPKNIAVSGNYAYVASNYSSQELQIIDISNPASPFLIGSLELGTSSGANEIYVSSNYAYIASNKDSAELQVVDISTPASPTLAASLDLSGAQDGSTITGFGNTVIVGRLGSGGVAIINITNATAINSQAIGASAASLSVDTTVFDLSGGSIRIKEGVSAAVNLTSSKVTVSSLNFQNLSRAGTPNTIRVSFTISFINSSGRNEYSFTQNFYGSSGLRK